MGRAKTERHFEPYLHLAGLTHEAVLISWGGFFFERAPGERWHLVEEGARHGGPSRRETIGARSAPYGGAIVEVREGDHVVARAETDTQNHLWLGGLEPDRRYEYRCEVDGRPWAGGPLFDWVADADGGRLEQSHRAYARTFRTHPAPEAPQDLVFAVIGDYGYGVRCADEDGLRQKRVARALERAVDERDVRLLLTTGDNIYLGAEGTIGGTGAEDDDWFFTYYQPYRYVIERVPVYPAVGNHDSSDEEASDDREQVADNFFLDERFRPDVAHGRASLDPGLFYRFRFGRDVEFIALDTTRADDLESEHYFDHPRHRRFLEESLPDRGGLARSEPRWSIPFSHHPPFCAGPSHPNMEGLIDRLVPLAHRAGVRLVLSGHEHNFQHAVFEGVHFVITGAAGKLRPEPPTRFASAHTIAWGAEGHFLLVAVERDALRVEPVAGIEEGEPLRCIALRTPEGKSASAPIVVTHAASPMQEDRR